MNNLAISFAQSRVEIPQDLTADGGSGLPTSKQGSSPGELRKGYLEAAKRWAANANQHAKQTQGEQRTAECDEACAVSLCNLGDIAAMSGDSSEARRMFEECIAMSQSLGFAQGIAQAQEGLKRLERPAVNT